MDTSYVPLRLRSNWSLLQGGSRLADCLARAAEWRLPALALTDDNLFGAVPFFEEAGRFGVRPILGATVRDGTHEAALLVQDEAGYASLCRILTERDLAGEDFSLGAALRRHGAGLILLAREAGFAEAMREAFPDRVFLEASLSGPPYQGDLPLVASWEAFFARPSDFEVHRLLTAFRLGETLQGLEEARTAGPAAYLHSPEEMARLFRDVPHALRNTRAIAERCGFDLLGRRTVFPRIAGADGPRILRERAFAGARRRFGWIAPEVRERIEGELEMIIRMGFADYFLVVEDIVRHARSLGTPTAGRGSGAGSLVSYVLGITNVDPLKFDLPFERFLNPGRKDYPDLDVDFCWRLRDEVIDYTYNRFGHDRVAMIATYATFQPRLALRETAKAFGLSNPVITAIARKLKQGLPRSRFDTLPADPGVLERVLDLSRRIQGFPHHLSVHCGGVVIAPDSVANHAPLLRAEKGVVITAYDKDAVERVGLVKIDLLGNRSLSTISETVRRIEERTGEKVDPEALPERDPAVFALIRAGRTVGCGQLESPAMRHLLVQMRPKETLHLMQALALIRPGAAGEGMKERFVRRRQGLEPAPLLSPALERVLGEAHGVMLYEDDAMRVPMAVAGLDAGEADRLRRAVLKCGNGEDLRRLTELFLARCEERGFGREQGGRLLALLAKFRSYSFCRAHAASYGVLAYASAYLKTRHPLEYWTAALNNNEGMYPKWVLVEEAKRSADLAVLAPCANRSELEFTVEGCAIRAGLNCIASLSLGAMERILDNAPFASLEDLVARARPREGEVELLVRCGALDFTGQARNRLMWKVMTSYRKMRASAGMVREGEGLGLAMPCPAPSREAAVPALPELEPAQLWKDEWEIMGFTCREHPLAALRPRLRASGIAFSTEIPKCAGRAIRLGGVIAAGRRIRTERGELMQFLTLDDEAGVFEAVLFPDAYKKTRFLLDGPGPYIVEGRVENQYGALTVTASRLEAMEG